MVVWQDTSFPFVPRHLLALLAADLSPSHVFDQVHVKPLNCIEIAILNGKCEEKRF